MLQIYIKAAQIKKESFPHTIITGQSGCGKAQPVDTIIPTPDGDKRLGDIAVGDYVFDRLGLQGLLDTDGYAMVSKDNRTSVSFTSVNINLIHDVIRLANSLGFYCPRIYSDTRKKYKTGISNWH